MAPPLQVNIISCGPGSHDGGGRIATDTHMDRYHSTYHRLAHILNHFHQALRLSLFRSGTINFHGTSLWTG